MKSLRSRGWICSLVVASAFASSGARAEKTLLKNDEFEVYTDGRVGAFVSYAHGQGYPQPAFDANGKQLHDISGGGLNVLAERENITAAQLTQGTTERWRVRSGMIGNTLGVGVRANLNETTKATAYIQIWAYIESEQQRKNRPNPADIRQGYIKLEGPWGSVVAGRQRTLFSRGATDIDVAYADRFALGYPGNTDSNGPTSGHIGFGVLGSGFGAGLVYATPLFAGLQLSVGAYDPIALQGAWERTNLPRVESELNFEQPLGDFGKVMVFGNGAYQKVYKRDNADSTTASGFGYGGRVELGPFHLGVAGHSGTGLGLNYALEASDATLDAVGNLRKFDGYYVQSQVVLGHVDLQAGWGITRVFLSDFDVQPDDSGNVPHSVIKSQVGISGGVVYHAKPWLHLDLDYFRADFTWFQGEKQVVNFVNTGMTFTW